MVSAIGCSPMYASSILAGGILIISLKEILNYSSESNSPTKLIFMPVCFTSISCFAFSEIGVTEIFHISGMAGGYLFSYFRVTFKGKI